MRPVSPNAGRRNHLRSQLKSPGLPTARVITVPNSNHYVYLKGAVFCLTYVGGVHHGDDAAGDQEIGHAVVIATETAPNFKTGAAAWTPHEGRTWFKLPGVRLGATFAIQRNLGA
jgi:hypothetical protein